MGNPAARMNSVSGSGPVPEIKISDHDLNELSPTLRADKNEEDICLSNSDRETLQELVNRYIFWRDAELNAQPLSEKAERLSLVERATEEFFRFASGELLGSDDVGTSLNADIVRALEARNVSLNTETLWLPSKIENDLEQASEKLEFSRAYLEANMTFLVGFLIELNVVLKQIREEVDQDIAKREVGSETAMLLRRSQETLEIGQRTTDFYTGLTSMARMIHPTFPF